MSEQINGVTVSSSAFVYANVIMNNKYEFKNVKKRFKSDVAVILVCNGYGDKVTGTDSTTGKTWLEIANERIAAANEEE